jgi:hypothetical protein
MKTQVEQYTTSALSLLVRTMAEKEHVDAFVQAAQEAKQ